MSLTPHRSTEPHRRIQKEQNSGDRDSAIGDRGLPELEVRAEEVDDALQPVRAAVRPSESLVADPWGEVIAMLGGRRPTRSGMQACRSAFS